MRGPGRTCLIQKYLGSCVAARLHGCCINTKRGRGKAALEWINMLLEKTPSNMGRFVQELLPSLLKTLEDIDDEVVLMNLQVSQIIYTPCRRTRVKRRECKQ